MCGIAGILSLNSDLRERKNLIESISLSLKMRGPDAKGEIIRPYAALIHRRLSVIDPKNGAQPMTFGKYTIVYNGEIYNTQEVRHELESFGYKFKTACDTEVVLKAYDKWKEESAKKLNGIFAYGVYDDEDRKLFLCRDRIGVKPLYYSKKGGLFTFASRINSLLLIPEVTSDVDADGLNAIFMTGPAKKVGSAVFRDIAELEPGTYMLVDADNNFKKTQVLGADRKGTYRQFQSDR